MHEHKRKEQREQKTSGADVDVAHVIVDVDDNRLKKIGNVETLFGEHSDGEWETQSLQLCYGYSGTKKSVAKIKFDSLKCAAKLNVAFGFGSKMLKTGVVGTIMHTKILHYSRDLNLSLLQKT